MNLKKLTAWLLMLSLTLVLLSGCEGDRPDGSDPSSPSGAALSTSADPDRASLHQAIRDSGCPAGMAFLSFVAGQTTEAELRVYLKSSSYAEKYAFLADAPFVDAGGTELYAVVTDGKESRVSVYPAAINEAGRYDVDTDHALYEGTGADGFLLRCNVSDIHANVVVSLQNGGEVLSVFPQLSGKDGRLVAEGCYDFSVYDDDDGIDDDVVIAYGLLLEADEVRHYTDQGWSLQYTGETLVIEGRPCWIFALGTERNDQFVREFYYGVCDNLIYSYDAISDTWSVLGAG